MCVYLISQSTSAVFNCSKRVFVILTGECVLCSLHRLTLPNVILLLCRQKYGHRGHKVLHIIKGKKALVNYNNDCVNMLNR